jgi:DNA-directed RNA polymerase subunit beta-beta'
VDEFCIRRSFGKKIKQIDSSNLISIQKNSYASFLQTDIEPDKRKNEGLQAVLTEAFDDKDINAKNEIKFISYSLESSKHTEEDCIKKDLTYSISLRVQLLHTRYDSKGPSRIVKEIKEHSIFFADIPLMTNDASFIINGTRRVIVSQLHKSTGVFFAIDTKNGTKISYSAHIIPFRGAWIDFEIDQKGILWARIDKRRKILLTTFLMLIDMDNREQNRKFFSKQDILSTFYNVITLNNHGDKWSFDFKEASWRNTTTSCNVFDKNNVCVLKAGEKINERKLQELAQINQLFIASENLLGLYIAEPVVINEVIAFNAGDEITEENLEICNKIKSLRVLNIDHSRSNYIRDTLIVDQNNCLEDALRVFYSIVRPGETITTEGAMQLVQSMFFDFNKSDLSIVGRMKMNSRLKKWHSKSDIQSRTLTRDDIIAVVKGLIDVKEGKEKPDDIDHLARRRVRSVGELVANQCQTAMFKLVKTLRERLNLVEAEEEVNLYDLVNTRILTAAIREFFYISQLSQIVDNVNGLAEVSHKRRVTAIGQGGLDSARATFAARDVHSSHYGKICAVESPEGQNIGLINSLAVHARIDEYGFIQTPYRKVINGIITDEIIYFNADEEEKYAIASYCVTIDANNRILSEKVSCRFHGDYVILPPTKIEYIDVASNQILSVASGLIPFIENNDPTRCLYGANMQRQALPLKDPESPFVGTGLEKQVGIDSMTVALSRFDGVVTQLDSSKILIQRSNEPDKIDSYILKKFHRSNASSCINQRPIVNCGDRVTAGQIIADGSTTSHGEIALGKNLRIAFMSFKGFSFEDSVVISKRVLNDHLTSIKLEELEISIKEEEEITRSVPGVSDELLKNLDETGIVYVGAKVKQGDIVVGRTTPKPEGPSSPEERLLKAMFGEKANNVIDASLRVPPGYNGTIIDVQIFSRKGLEKDERTLLIERIEIQKLSKNRDLELIGITSNYKQYLEKLLLQEKTETKSKHLLTKEILHDMDIDDLLAIVVKNDAKTQEIKNIEIALKNARKNINETFEKNVKSLQAGDILPPGVAKIVKVFIASNRVIEQGDKVVDRFGNKGVIATILPEEDMPFDKDGPVDIILNPLSIAARMNIGQIFETHIGWVSKEIGKQVSDLLGKIYNNKKTFDDLRQLLCKAYSNDVATVSDMSHEKLADTAVAISKGMKFAMPSFDSARLEDIKKLLIEWGLPESGQILLRDGQTGEYFERPITVGYKFILKLNHMALDKRHARSTGSYSLVTQQPQGGKAKMGGQRQGEMETWALEAYGAAHIIRESMTIKSDDYEGRLRVYEAITQGYEVTDESASLPAAFDILLREMRGLCINLECITKHTDENGNISWTPALGTSKIDALRASIMSPEQIKKMSFGEVKRSETINYRTQKAELEGLYCPAIFGPEKDYKCSCGRYVKMKNRGIICEKCKVEVTVSRVRRERMGHIELATPVAHIWFSKILPSKIGMISGLTSKNLEKILRFEQYVVIKSGTTPLEKGHFLSEEEFTQAKKQYGIDAFTAMTGGEGVEALLKTINLEEERTRLLYALEQKPQELLRRKLIKKLQIVSGFIETKTKPEWMIIRTLPVIPPELRPIVPLDAGRFATSDINELYRKVINRNNRLKELQAYDFPDIIIRNEKRMLQNSVDALIDNSRLDKPATGTNGHVLQSIGDGLKGKTGRFRQNLLGKRVDYSGRAVIIVGANLKLHQCGVPKIMALELFKPFVYARLEQYGYATTLRSAKRIVEEQRPEVWEILKEVCYQHPVLLNRNPTLHRLGIQAFEVVLVDHNAIELHPLVCSAFNADFDGDQMAIHVPLSVEAQIEARVLMTPINNMINPANGKTVLSPKKDMILGLYYLTHIKKGAHGEGVLFDQSEINKIVFEKAVHLNAEIKCSIECPVEGRKIFTTTPGRVILFNILPKEAKLSFSLVNKLITSKDTTEIFMAVYHNASRQECAKFADDFMRLGFDYATFSGISLSYANVMIESKKNEKIEQTWTIINELQRQFNDGLITENERKNKISDAWSKCDEELGKTIAESLSIQKPGEPINSIYMMYHSGARGSATQMKQMLAMRGMIAKPNGEMLENAVPENYSEGLGTHSFFLATHGTRKGLADSALKTADAGYFSRKLVDAAQDGIITSEDCALSNDNIYEQLKSNCITFEAITIDGNFNFSGAFGRVMAEDALNPRDNSILIPKNTLLSTEHIKILEDASILSIKIRSPITCANEFGICAKCYGMDLSKFKLVCVGEVIGVIAAQSIGEPGAQLTLQSFHAGGGAKFAAGNATIKAICNGTVSFRGAKFAERDDHTKIMISKQAEIKIIDDFGRERTVERVPYGAKIYVNEGQKIEREDVLCEWDKYIVPKLAPVDGFAVYVDLIDNVSLKQIVDENTGIVTRIVCDWKRAKHHNITPTIIFVDKDGKKILAPDKTPLTYILESDEVIVVDNNAAVKMGDLVVKKQNTAARSGDIITTGLPKLIEIFEARTTKLSAILSEVDVIVAAGKDYRSKKTIVVIDEHGNNREYIISKEHNIIVQIGDPIKKGDPISDGDISPHDILRVMGFDSAILCLLNQIQGVFNAQGISVDNRHVECVLKYMLRKVEITEAGNSEYVVGEMIEYVDFIKTLQKNYANPPKARLILIGISKAASTDPSFIKSACFQEAPKVLSQAVYGKEDELRGTTRLIAGLLMQAGTGVVMSQWEKQYINTKQSDAK